MNLNSVKNDVSCFLGSAEAVVHFSDNILHHYAKVNKVEHVYILPQ